MNPHDNNSSIESSTLKRIKPRYIVVNEDIFNALDPDSLKVYMALRYEVDYQSDCASVKKNIKAICNATCIKRTSCFAAISNLEFLGLIIREKNPGYQSTYWVAQDLGYFTPSKNIEIQGTREIDQPPVQNVVDPVQPANYPVQPANDIINNSFNNISYIKPLVDFQSTSSYKDDSLFMMFYSIYPNKQKPEVARKAFYKHKPTQEFVSMLCVDVYKRVENNWKNRHKNKIPFPATYLNSKEWEGEIVEPETMESRFKPKTKYKTFAEISGESL